MPPNDGAIWTLIRDWELPDLPAPEAWSARKRASVEFEVRVENALILTEKNARGLIAAYRQ